MPRVFVFSAAALVLFLVPGAHAHHPFAAEFDRDKPVIVTGTVKTFELVNPHSALQINGRDATGRAGEWVIELGGAQELTRGGWSKTSVKVGDTITVEGWMARDGSRRVNAKRVKTSSGKRLNAGSSR